MRRSYCYFVVTKNFFTIKIRDRNWRSKIRGKEYADLRRKIKNQHSKSVTQCWLENQQTFFLLPTRAPVVTQREQEKVAVCDKQGKETTRNSCFFKLYLNTNEPSSKTVNENATWLEQQQPWPFHK